MEHISALKWISHGGAQGASGRKILSEFIDVSCAAYATYFDGLLSNDGKLQAVFAKGSALLKEIEGAELFEPRSGRFGDPWRPKPTCSPR
jgi:hypothetical protein